jgi:hypothetical protein
VNHKKHVQSRSGIRLRGETSDGLT